MFFAGDDIGFGGADPADLLWRIVIPYGFTYDERIVACAVAGLVGDPCRLGEKNNSSVET